jgi:hypothetical protein
MRMMDVWRYIAEVLGISALLVPALAWLVKRIVESELARDRDLRNIQLSALQTKRVEALRRLHFALERAVISAINVQRASYESFFSSERGRPDMEALVDASLLALDKAAKRHYQCRFFLPAVSAKKVSELLNVLGEPHEGVPAEDITKLSKAERSDQLDALKRLNVVGLVQALNEIERECRKLLGTQ